MILMDTLVSIEVIPSRSAGDCAERVERAFDWFRQAEQVCSRFDERSEVMGLTARIGEPVEVSPLLFRVVEFALAVAELSDGAFDPTIGYLLETRGFNREYRTGHLVQTDLASDGGEASYHDVVLDQARQTITLRRPLILDLGAVAKGFAIDLAARELLPLRDFAIDAGGDLYVHGKNAADEPWRIGIRHPRQPHELSEIVSLTAGAVCTSGDYERVSPTDPDQHHIVDPRTGHSSTSVASVTVVAPSAMLADALATAAFVLGPERGLGLLDEAGVGGLIVTPDLRSVETRSFATYRGARDSTIAVPPSAS